MSKFLKRIDFVTSGLIYSIRQMFSSTVNTVMERKAHKEHGTSSQQTRTMFISSFSSDTEQTSL